MVVVRRALVSVAVKRHLDGVRVVVSRCVVVVLEFMEGEGENRRAAEGPQQ